MRGVSGSTLLVLNLLTIGLALLLVACPPHIDKEDDDDDDNDNNDGSPCDAQCLIDYDNELLACTEAQLDCLGDCGENDWACQNQCAAAAWDCWLTAWDVLSDCVQPCWSCLMDAFTCSFDCTAEYSTCSIECGPGAGCLLACEGQYLDCAVDCDDALLDCIDWYPADCINNCAKAQGSCLGQCGALPTVWAREMCYEECHADYYECGAECLE